jgi:membrane protease YdiL (CAAX protease family)
MRAKSALLKFSPADKPGVQTVPWHPVWGVVLPVSLYLVTPVIATVALGLYGATQGWNVPRVTSWLSDSVYAQFAFMVISQGLILAGLALFLRRYKVSFGIIGLTKAKWADVGYAAGGYAVYFVIYLIFATLLTVLVPSFNPSQEQDIGFEAATGILPLSLVFISLVILPPIAEEIIMRGFLYSSIRKYRGVLMATLLTSVVFAIAHLQGGNPSEGLLWVAAVDTFVLSLVLCHLRERTGRLWACIGVHAIKNCVAFTFLFIIGPP